MQEPHELVRFLAERDVPCPGCTYNLRGLTSDRCPECNQPLTLSVRLVDPKMGAFLFAVIGIGMALGFCTLVLMWGLIQGAPKRELVPLWIGTGVGSVLLWLWIASRRRTQKMSSFGRWRAGVLLTLAALACPLWFMFTVR